MAHPAHHKGSFFTRFSSVISRLAGRPEATVLAGAIILVWAATGPLLDYSETWQLVINTGTTIITFLMVFIIQASQNRDTAALHLKIDELIRATEQAQNVLLDIDRLDEATLEKLRQKYEALAHEASQQGISPSADTPVDNAKRTDAPDAVRRSVDEAD